MRAQNADLGVAGLDHAQRPDGVDLLEVDLGAGVRLHEAGHEVAGKRVDRAFAQGDFEHGATVRPAVAVLHLLVERQQGGYLVQERRAFGGEAHAAVVGVQEAQAGLVLELGNGLAERLAGDKQALGRLVKAAHAGDLGKPLHLTDIHAAPAFCAGVEALQRCLVTSGCTHVPG